MPAEDELEELQIGQRPEEVHEQQLNDAALLEDEEEDIFGFDADDMGPAAYAAQGVELQQVGPAAPALQDAPRDEPRVEQQPPAKKARTVEAEEMRRCPTEGE